ncbi:MAG: D-alanyl-D-alanine carboxypeptidase family protein [Peptococcaceae bacterium]|nr:D-alanyl-D-alanine carboxypeptidase family protein [Peptococcaceae bacterium]
MKKHPKLICAFLSAALLMMSMTPALAEENANPIEPPEVEEPGDQTPGEEVPGDNEPGDPIITVTEPAYHDSHQEADGVSVVSGILLVNKTHPLPADYAPSYTAGAGQSNSLQGEADAAAQAFLADCNAQGNSMYILSGYRSYDVQADLFANYAAIHGEEAANRFSARAGQSEHQTGLAFDVGDAQHSGYNLETSIDQFPGVQWMMQHCADYGFILRYPEGKENITGYQYEPWHFRYVGVEAAKDIQASGLTLEEYLGAVQTDASGGRQMAIGASDNNLEVDGHYSKVASYNIGGNNYFRLRDLATILADTNACFDVGYDDSQRLITVQKNTPLTGAGSLIQLSRTDIAVPNTMTVMVDGYYVAPTAYNIDGFTYFKLRDLGTILGFGVAWDNEAQSMVITTENNQIIDSLLAPVTIDEA